MQLKSAMKHIISASRRTDIPAWYLDRLIDALKKGYAEVPNPYSRKTVTVDLRPDNVHTIVLWSKNFGPFLENRRPFAGYRLYALFTVNDMPAFEPRVPPLDQRLDQIYRLADALGPDRIAWRYEPVVFTSAGLASSVESFGRIGRVAAASGIKRAICSLLDLYGKVSKRSERMGLDFVEPSKEKAAACLRQLAAISRSLGLSLETCCEDSPGVDGIAASACIDGKLLGSLAGEPATVAKDPGQRTSCNCTVSRDIGSYRDMPCPSGCRYCYARR